LQLGIDWVSLAIFAAAFVVAQIRAIPLRVRFGLLAIAFAVIAALRLRMDRVGPNFLFGVVAALFSVYYLVRAFRAR